MASSYGTVQLWVHMYINLFISWLFQVLRWYVPVRTTTYWGTHFHYKITSQCTVDSRSRHSNWQIISIKPKIWCCRDKIENLWSSKIGNVRLDVSSCVRNHMCCVSLVILFISATVFSRVLTKSSRYRFISPLLITDSWPSSDWSLIAQVTLTVTGYNLFIAK